MKIRCICLLSKWMTLRLSVILLSLLAGALPFGALGVSQLAGKQECPIVNENDLENTYWEVYKATEAGNVESVRECLKQGLDPNTAIYYLKDLQDGPPAYMGSLDVAVLEGKTDIVKLLLESGAWVDGCATSLYEPLCQAVTRNHQAILELLLKHGANPDALCGYGQPGEKPSDLRAVIFDAIGAKHDGMLSNLELLIQSGADINVRRNERPVIIEASDRFWAALTVPLLISHGVQIDFPYRGGNILHFMVEDIYDDSVDYALRQLISAYISVGGHHAIEYAEQNAQYKSQLESVRKQVISFITPKGRLSGRIIRNAMVAHLDRSGLKKLLRQLASDKRWQLVYSVSSNGKAIGLNQIADVDPNQVDENGDTPLAIAVRHDNSMAISWLIRMGADPGHLSDAAASGFCPKKLRCKLINQLFELGAHLFLRIL